MFAVTAAQKVTFPAIVRRNSHDVMVIDVDKTTGTDVVVVIDVDKLAKTNIVLRSLETIVVSRRHSKLRSKRLLMTLPATKRVIHLLLPEQM